MDHVEATRKPPTNVTSSKVATTSDARSDEEKKTQHIGNIRKKAIESGEERGGGTWIYG